MKFSLKNTTRLRTNEYPIFDDYKRSTTFNELLSITDHLCMFQNGSFLISVIRIKCLLEIVGCIKAMAKQHCMLLFIQCLLIKISLTRRWSMLCLTSISSVTFRMVFSLFFSFSNPIKSMLHCWLKQMSNCCSSMKTIQYNLLTILLTDTFKKNIVYNLDIVCKLTLLKLEQSLLLKQRNV